VSLILGVTNRGEVFFTCNHGRNNSTTLQLFFSQLVSFLDSYDTLWRADTVVMLDNASYHKSKIFLNSMQSIPLMFLGPYQFRMAPVELAFAYLKGGNLISSAFRGGVQS
jgi:hypothetical protein